MASKNRAEQYSHADFTAAVSAETGLSPSQLTRRADPAVERSEDDLAERARANNEKRQAEGSENLPDSLKPFLEQYEDQLTSLTESGLIDLDVSAGKHRLHGVDGTPYWAPTAEQFAEHLARQEELVERKKEQGFDRLLLVPMGLPLRKIAERYGEALKEAHANGSLRGAKGETLELDTDQPVYDWVEMFDADEKNEIVYDPKSLDENHDGTRKPGLVEMMPVQGWQVLIVEDPTNQDLINLPKKGQHKAGRVQHSTGTSPEDALKQLQTDLQYEGELGLTPEAYLMLALQQLKEHGQVLDTETATALVGSYIPGQRGVPFANWSPTHRRVFLGAGDPDYSGGYWGVRSAVRVI